MILIALIAMSNGRAGSRIIMSYAKEYIKKKRHLTTKSKCTEKQFQNALTLLKKDNLIIQEKTGLWRIIKKGKEEAHRLLTSIERRESYPEPKQGPVHTIVIFDIPERERDKRALVRVELRALEFKLLQKSVWVGTGPLPKKCVAYFHDINALPYIHIFSVNRPGTIA